MKTKKTFEVEIEAKISVQAFNEEAARKKVAAALGERRQLAADVESTGEVWTYAATLRS